MERANSVQIIHTTRALAELGHDVHLFVRRSWGTSEEEALQYYGLKPHDNLHIHRVPVLNVQGFPGAQKIWNYSYYMALLPQLFKQAKSSNSVLFVRDIGFAAKLLNWNVKCPLVFESHGVDTMLVKNFSSWQGSDRYADTQKHETRISNFEKTVMEKASGIITLTEVLRNCLDELYDLGDKPTQVVADGCLPPEPLPDFLQRDGSILYAGQLYPWKGVDLLVEAMKYLPDKTLKILGGLPFDDDKKRLEKKVAELGIKDRVIFLGQVRHNQVARYLRESSVGVLPLPDIPPAAIFTSPLKLFEYMASGLPIVLSDLPSLREIIKDGETGLFYKPDDAKSLSEALRESLANPVKSEAMAEAAWQKVSEFTWDKRAEKITYFLKKINGKN